MKEINVIFNKINTGAILPTYAHKGDSGMDVYIPENYFEEGSRELKPLERIIIKTGLKIKFDSDYELQVRSKSGRSIKEGLVVINQPGTIEHTYQGEICVGLINLSNEIIRLENGKPIAQLVLSPVVNTVNSVVGIYYSDNKSDKDFFGFKSERGTGGLGSTYKKFDVVEEKSND